MPRVFQGLEAHVTDRHPCTTWSLSMHVSDEELAKRKAETELPPLYSRGVLGKYAHIVSSASRGAVTDFWNMDKSGKA